MTRPYSGTEFVANICCEFATKLLFLIAEQHIWIYAGNNVALAHLTGQGSFLNNQFLKPG